MSKLIDEIVVAIPDRVEDDILAAYLNEMPVAIFRGSEEDVLSRVFHAAQVKEATHVVRICADNPLISGSEIDNLILHYQSYSCDYAYNHVPNRNRYPDGLGAEIVSFDLLKNLQETVSDPFHREHCFTYINAHPDRFLIRTFDPPNEKLWRPELKLDLDTIEDYRYLALNKVTIDATAEQVIDSFSG